MGNKSKAEKHELVEIIIESWEGGKNTIVYVTEDVNNKLKELGFKVALSRESIRRVLRNHKEKMGEVQKSIEIAKQFAEVLKDYPATEASEAMLIQLSSLITKDMNSIDGLNFENPLDIITAATKIADSQVKLASFRTKAIKALDKAKNEIKKELQKAIQNDAELLEKLYKIVDKVEIK